MKNVNNEKIKQLKQQKKDMQKEIATLEEKGVSSKIKSALLFLALVIVFLGFLAGMIKADVGGFGSGILAPVIGDINGLNKILPVSSLTSSNTNNTTTASIDNVSIAGSSSVTDTTQTSSNTTDTSQATANAANTTDVSQTANTTDTAQIPNRQTSSQSGTGTTAASDTQAAEDAKLADYVDTYSKMDAKSAASILGNMTGDLPLVAKILTNMRASKRADIMANLDVNIASKLTVLMSNP